MLNRSNSLWLQTSWFRLNCEGTTFLPEKKILSMNYSDGGKTSSSFWYYLFCFHCITQTWTLNQTDASDRMLLMDFLPCSSSKLFIFYFKHWHDGTLYLLYPRSWTNGHFPFKPLVTGGHVGGNTSAQTISVKPLLFLHFALFCFSILNLYFITR